MGFFGKIFKKVAGGLLGGGGGGGQKAPFRFQGLIDDGSKRVSLASQVAGQVRGSSGIVKAGLKASTALSGVLGSPSPAVDFAQTVDSDLGDAFSTLLGKNPLGGLVDFGLKQVGIELGGIANIFKKFL